MALRQGFRPVLLFSQVGFIVIFIYMLLLPEGQMDEAREPSKNLCAFGKMGALGRPVGYFSFASL